MLRVPQHRLDSPIVLIHEMDDAWDHQRIVQEAQGKPTHPVRRYWAGETRYDLTAEVQAYLQPDKAPTRFFLRRLTWEQYQRCVQSMEQGQARVAFAAAAMQALTKVENGPIVIEGDGPSWKDMQSLHDASTPDCDLVFSIGYAAYKAAAPLSPAEKKV